MALEFVFFFVLAVAAFIAIAVAARWFDEKRRKELAAVAAANGWSYQRDDAAGRPGRYEAFEPFGRGFARRAGNVITGERDGARFELFDYEYKERHHNGRTQTTVTYPFHVVAVRMPRDAPDLVIRDEHLGHKLLDAVGGEDIDFESHEFSRRFWVRCRDRRFAYDVLDPRMMEYLLPTRGWVWQWRGRDLVLVAKGKLQPGVAAEAVSLAAGFVVRVPRHVVA